MKRRGTKGQGRAAGRNTNDAAIPQQLQWQTLLKEAIDKPGTISQAYRAFHGYSLGNTIAALIQCFNSGIEPGPIATYKSWLDKGRHVTRGEKALYLCTPRTRKLSQVNDQLDNSEEEEITITRFSWEPRWFVLSQTEGEPIEAQGSPEWNRTLALTNLAITEIDFHSLDGNIQGYARERSIAINPLNKLSHKTTFHEISHILLGHTADDQMTDGESTPKALREIEAESVALLCCESLGLEGSDFSRGYIQHWNQGGNMIPERSAQRIFKAADEILKAGHPPST